MSLWNTAGFTAGGTAEMLLQQMLPVYENIDCLGVAGEMDSVIYDLTSMTDDFFSPDRTLTRLEQIRYYFGFGTK